MTELKLDKLKDAIRARKSPSETMSVISRGKHYSPWHIQVLNDKLLEMTERKLDRLIVTMPPRHGKSTMISYYFPTWYLGTHPDHRVMLASYEAELAASWGSKVRDALTAYGEDLFDITVNPASAAKDRWDVLDHDGGMVCVGVGGPLTGRGCDLMIIDDYIKNSEEARSQIIREKHWDWWTGTASTRLEPGAITVVLATRWHGDDLIGRLIDTDPIGWEVIHFPAIATHDEEYRKEGEALWPARFDVPALRRIQRRSPFWFNAEYQGNPSSEEGDVFKRHGIRYWRSGKATTLDGEIVDGYLLKQLNSDEVFVKASTCWRFITCDLAASERESADYTVFQVWAVTPQADMILLDQIRGRIPGPEKLPALKGLIARYDVSYAGIEKAGFQLDFIQNARWAGLPVFELTPKGDKMGRAIEASVRWENGQVYLPSNEYWVSAFIEEVCTFDHAPHDDQVDALSYAAIEVSRRGFSPSYAFGLHTCHHCGQMYTLTARTGLDRPCPYCHTPPIMDAVDTLVPLKEEEHDEAPQEAQWGHARTVHKS